MDIFVRNCQNHDRVIESAAQLQLNKLQCCVWEK
jgi:hypothetical protein